MRIEALSEARAACAIVVCLSFGLDLVALAWRFEPLAPALFGASVLMTVSSLYGLKKIGDGQREFRRQKQRESDKRGQRDWAEDAERTFVDRVEECIREWDSSISEKGDSQYANAKDVRVLDIFRHVGLSSRNIVVAALIRNENTVEAVLIEIAMSKDREVLRPVNVLVAKVHCVAFCRDFARLAKATDRPMLAVVRGHSLTDIIAEYSAPRPMGSSC